MSNANVIQSTDFNIKELSIVSKGGKIDVREMFDELNIYDGMLSPVRSGNILIRDAIGLSEILLLDGSEFLIINIEKGDNFLPFVASFKIYKQTNRKNINESSETYILHFVADELIYSYQQKINQCYTGTYADAAVSILINYLKVPVVEMRGIFDSSVGVREFIIPNLSPIEAIEWCSKRSIDVKGAPNFVFFQNANGFNFCSLSSIQRQKPLYNINFNVKNTTENLGEEILGARGYEILSQFDYMRNTKSGVYSGKFIGIDLLARNISSTNKSYFDQYSLMDNANQNPSLTADKNRDGKYNFQMPESRVVLYSFSEAQKFSNYVKTNAPTNLSKLDDSHNYIFQRRALFENFMNKRIRVLMPGSFALSSGYNVSLKMPTRAFKNDQRDDTDSTLNGVYSIIATRHIIKYNMHETVIDIASGSSQKPIVARNKVVKQEEITSDSYGGIIAA